MSARIPAAVLWDMDGTIIDTEALWLNAQQGMVARFGLPPLTPADDIALVGASKQTTAEFFRAKGVPLPPEEIPAAIQDEVTAQIRTGVVWRPGARELLAELRDAGVPTALVTNSSLDMVEAMLVHLPEHRFDVLVTAEDVARGKPEPAPFRLAASRLGLEPSACLVIEDSPTGLASARAAGCLVLAVPHAVAIPAQPGQARVESLGGVTWPELQTIAAALHADRRDPTADIESDPTTA